MRSPETTRRAAPSRLVVVIPTAGAVDKLESTLTSLTRCDRPDIYSKTIVVENGARTGAERVARRFRDTLRVDYRFVPEANKSSALNRCLQTLESGALVYFTDDDVRFDPGVLTAIAAAADGKGSKIVLGGRVDIDRGERGPVDVRPWMPASIVGFPGRKVRAGWAPRGFLGANWAAYSDEILELGGFDARFGPGSSPSATGQESNMMRRMREAGFAFEYVEDAIVTHVLDPRCDRLAWMAARKYRQGVELGLDWDRLRRLRSADPETRSNDEKRSGRRRGRFVEHAGLRLLLFSVVSAGILRGRAAALCEGRARREARESRIKPQSAPDDGLAGRSPRVEGTGRAEPGAVLELDRREPSGCPRMRPKDAGQVG